MGWSRVIRERRLCFVQRFSSNGKSVFCSSLLTCKHHFRLNLTSVDPLNGHQSGSERSNRYQHSSRFPRLPQPVLPHRSPQRPNDQVRIRRAGGLWLSVQAHGYSARTAVRYVSTLEADVVRCQWGPEAIRRQREEGKHVARKVASVTASQGVRDARLKIFVVEDIAEDSEALKSSSAELV